MRNPRRDTQTGVNLKVNDRVNLDVAVNLKVGVEVDVIVRFLEITALFATVPLSASYFRTPPMLLSLKEETFT